MTVKLMFNQLPESEQEDFIATCKKRNLTEMDFLVGMEEKYPKQGVGPIEREAIVARINNGKSKRYPAGNGHAWIVAFENDLFSLYFD